MSREDDILSAYPPVRYAKIMAEVLILIDIDKNKTARLKMFSRVVLTLLVIEIASMMNSDQKSRSRHSFYYR